VITSLHILHTSVRAYEISIHKDLWTPVYSEGGTEPTSEISTARTAMALKMLQEARDFLKLFDTLQPHDYFHITYAIWCQLLYVLIVMNRIILLDSGPTTKEPLQEQQPISNTTGEHQNPREDSNVNRNWDSVLVARESGLLRLGQSIGRKLAKAASSIANDDEGTNLMTTFGLLVWSLSEGRQWADPSLGPVCSYASIPAVTAAATMAHANQQEQQQQHNSNFVGLGKSRPSSEIGDGLVGMQALPTPESSVEMGMGAAAPHSEMGPSQVAEWQMGFLDATWNTMLQDLTMMPLPVFDTGS
jgi:hypothetical protein